ncbi:MAG: EH signature domain-containing protein [Magnetococcus sp. DMHC-1]|nr:hypothetical protein [Magnetococcales bacterium]
MGLKEFLATLRHGHALPPLALPPEHPVHLEKALLELGNLEGKPPKPPPDLDAIERTLRTATKEGTLHFITARMWREVPWCLWRGARPWLAETGFLNDYLGRLGTHPRRSALRTLIHFYLLEFDPGKPGFITLAKVIADAVGHWDWKWAARQRNHRLFDPVTGPRRLCDAIMAHPQRDFAAIFAGAGLVHALAVGGFAAAGFAWALRTIHKELAAGTMTPAQMQQFLTWAGLEREGLRHPIHAPKLTTALLSPFRDHDPPETMKQAIRNFLVERIGDPRISSASTWDRLDQQDKNVILRWLLRFSLEQFIAIVKEFADQKEPDQWMFRQAFWMAYFRKGYIREAWVVLAKEPAAFASAKSRENQDPGMGRFGRVWGSPSNKQAVLLMKIGELIIADWSFIGKCRIWRANDSTAPNFYQNVYEAGQLNAQDDPSMAFPHSAPSGKGGWQLKISNRIRELTGIDMHASTYMP